MEIIQVGHSIDNISENANPANPSEINTNELYTELDINGDAIHYNFNEKDDTVKVVKNASDKFSELLSNEYETIKTNLSRMETANLNCLNPLQYPLFTNITPQSKSSMLTTAIFIGCSISIALNMRKKIKNNIKNDVKNDVNKITLQKSNNNTENAVLNNNTDIEFIDANCKISSSDTPNNTSLFSKWFR